MSLLKSIFVTSNGDLRDQNRVAYLDMLKCLGMFIVVQGHIHPHYGWFSLPLHSFVIPLYFSLSGITFRRGKFPTYWDFAKHRAKSLLLPYVMFSVLTWAIWAFFNYVSHANVDYLSPLLQTIFAQGSGGYLVHNVPLWFVPCLFVVESLYYFIDKLPKWINLTTCIVCAFIGSWMISGPYSGIMHRLPWSIESAFAAIIFYCVGNMLTKQWSLKEIEEKILDKRWVSIGIIIVLTTILVFSAHWNGHVSLGSDTLGRLPALFYINAFAGIITTFLFAVLICSIKSDVKCWSNLMDFHFFFGRNSFYIMATHVPIKGFLIVAFSKVLHQPQQFVQNDYACCAIIFAVTCFCCTILAYYIGELKKRDHERVEVRKKQK